MNIREKKSEEDINKKRMQKWAPNGITVYVGKSSKWVFLMGLAPRGGAR